MPQFIPAHTPRQVDSFTQGYLDCAEWLLDEEVNRDKLRGWSRDARLRAQGDCEQFQRENAAELNAYYEVTGRDEADAGHDFFLTRNGHGAGFWDRDSDPVNHPVLDQLTEASHGYGDADAYVARGWINWF